MFRNTLNVEYRVEPLRRIVAVRVLAGRFGVETDGVERRYEAGDVFLTARPDLGYRTEQQDVRMQVVGLDLSLLDSVADGPAARPGRFVAGPAAPALARYWQQTVEYVSSTVLGPDALPPNPLILGEAGRLLAVAALAVFAPQERADGPQDRTDATPDTVRRAIAFMESNPELDIGVADIARACHISVRAVQLAFRRHLGTTPMAYLRQVRLDRVRAELLEADPTTGPTVTRVAARWGFTSQSRFTAHYRATYGEAPNQTLRRRG